MDTGGSIGSGRQRRTAPVRESRRVRFGQEYMRRISDWDLPVEVMVCHLSIAAAHGAMQPQCLDCWSLSRFEHRIPKLSEVGHGNVGPSRDSNTAHPGGVYSVRVAGRGRHSCRRSSLAGSVTSTANREYASRQSRAIKQRGRRARKRSGRILPRIREIPELLGSC